MRSFEELNLSKHLLDALGELGFEKPTPIQTEACSVILSGRDVVGIAQTGTGKTFAYLLPILRDLKFSKELNPRVLILVPTRELVIQVVEQVKSLTRALNIRTMGVYGGTNINTQKIAVANGTDVLVATPGRLYDLVLDGALQLKIVKKLVIDEVDVMLDQGFRYQLTNIFDLLPARRQNIMFSATMTEEVDALINDFFISPHRIAIAVSGTPLHNISQQCYMTQNFLTKVNLLTWLLSNKEEFSKVLVFVSSKKFADRLYETIEEKLGSETSIVHSNKSQNYRIRSIQQFDKGFSRILITTDVMARGLDLDKISHVINFDTPAYPENYMHRIGRTGRAEQDGKSILFYTEMEEGAKLEIEALMNYTIPLTPFPPEVEISKELIPEESPRAVEIDLSKKTDTGIKQGAFHEKSALNKKTNQGGSYLRKRKTYKKPITKGDKNYNRSKGKKK